MVKSALNFIVSVILIAALMGIAYFIGGREFLMWVQARQWVETTCIVESASLSYSRGSDRKTSYGLSTLYRYQDESESFVGTRYDFRVGIGSSESGSYAKAARYLNNTKQVPCFYNPSSPKDSVIDRGFRLSMLFSTVPLALVLLFTILISKGARSRKR